MRIFGYVENEREVLRQLRELEDGVLREKVFGALQRGGEAVAAEARARVVVNTGRLKESIKVKGSKKTLSMKVEADYPKNAYTHKKKTKKQKAGSREYYAMAVEYGTRHVSARPFLMPAGEAKAQEITADVEKSMEEALHDTGSTL